MILRVSEAAEIIGGEVRGDPEAKFNTIASIETAGEGELTFLSSKKFQHFLATTTASVVIVKPEDCPTDHKFTVITHNDPSNAVNTLLRKLYAVEPIQPYRAPTAIISVETQISDQTYIGEYVNILENTRIGMNTHIGANCFIGKDVIIGENTKLFPNVTIYDNTEIGNNVIIHSGAVIGSDGFGYSGLDQHGYPHKVPQVGGVSIGDFVEIGANTTIDRGTLGKTTIGAGTKIDNLVQIAHNVKIGKRCLITAQVGVAGSTVIEDEVAIGGQAGFVDHIVIGKGTMVGAQSGISKSFPPGSVIFGSPAKDIKKALKEKALVSRLDKLFEEVKQIKKKIE